MSEYTVVQCEFNDAECIKASLKELGYNFEEHKEAQKLVGFEGGVRQQGAHIIIRRQHVGAASNDVGFNRKADGKYELVISAFDSRRGSKSAQDFLQNLKQTYAKHKTLKQLKKMGKTVSYVKTMKDGRIKIKALG